VPKPIIKLVIPARNEEDAIGQVVASVAPHVDAVIVADNGSTDKTADIARASGAIVVSVPEPGYGRACLAAIKKAGDFDILVFMDGDASDDPNDLNALLSPIVSGLRCAEIPVHYRARIGVSKISGTIKGVILAGSYILGTIFKEAMWNRHHPK